MQLALEKKERLPPSPCMHTASTWGEGKFCLDREFSKNAPYKQKIILHLASSDKMEQKKIFFAWTVDRWYLENRFWYASLPLLVGLLCHDKNIHLLLRGKAPYAFQSIAS